MSTLSPMADENKTNANPPPTSTTVNTGGGSAIHGNVTAGDDFVGRDKIVNNYYSAQPKPPTDSQEVALFIPFLRKSATEFVGRDAELVELHEKLQQNQLVGVRPAAALTGLGGIGKTQLAVEYAYRYQASYPGGIYWINAADLNRVRSQLVETAERMGLRTDYNTTDNALLAGLVKRCQQQPATLLCFDNAPDAVILWRRLTQELNTATLGAAILITTRRRDLPPNMAALDLRRLSDSTVCQLLATARPDLLTDPDLPRLLERLGGLPLVVSLVANALQNSPDATIADYLAALAQHGEETVHEELDVHVADYDLYREVYTRTLLPVLREQWERLCQQPKSENAQLLLRIAGQLPEAAEIPIARLGLLAGLQDEKVIKPLTSAIQSLWKVALIEELKEDAVRLHPLVRDFAAMLTPVSERNDFGIACACRLSIAYTNLERLSSEYVERGIAALLVDLITAIDFAQSATSLLEFPISNLQSLLRHLRLQSHHLQDAATSRQPRRLWQQMMLYASPNKINEFTLQLKKAFQTTLHWVTWNNQTKSAIIEQILTERQVSIQAVARLDVNHIISASNDFSLKMWNLVTGEVEQTFIGHKGVVNDVAVVDVNHIVSASDDCTIKIWNVSTGAVEQTLIGHTSYVKAVAVLDLLRIISASADHTLNIWNLTTGNVERSLIGHQESVNDVAVINAQYAVSAAGHVGELDWSLKIWNLETGQAEKTLYGHQSNVSLVTVIDAEHIVSAAGDIFGNDPYLRIWNWATGQEVRMARGHSGLVTAVAALNEQEIVFGSSDGDLVIWNWQSYAYRTLAGHGSRVNTVAVLDHNRIVSGSDDYTLRIWNLATKETTNYSVKGHDLRINAVAVINAQHIVSASSDWMLKVWDLVTMQVIRVLGGHKIHVFSVVLLDQQHIVSTGGDFGELDWTIKVWDLLTGKVNKTLSGHQNWIRAVAILDVQHIVSASDDKTLKVWNLSTGEVEQTLTGHKNGVRAVLSLTHSRIVSASADHTIKVWNLSTGQAEQTLIGHTGTVLSLAILDANHIASASDDHSIKIWNLSTALVEQTLNGHNDSVNALTVLDRNRIISASSDCTLKVWNLHTSEVIASIGLDGALTCVAVTRQHGRTLVVAGDAGGALYCLELVEPVAGN